MLDLNYHLKNYLGTALQEIMNRVKTLLFVPERWDWIAPLRIYLLHIQIEGERSFLGGWRQGLLRSQNQRLKKEGGKHFNIKILAKCNTGSLTKSGMKIPQKFQILFFLLSRSEKKKSHFKRGRHFYLLFKKNHQIWPTAGRFSRKALIAIFCTI